MFKMRKCIAILCLFAMLVTTLFSAFPVSAAPGGGTSALKVVGKDKNFHQVVNVTNGAEEYTVSLYVRGTGQIRLMIKDNPDWNTNFGDQTITPTDTWTKYTLTAKKTGGFKQPLFVIRAISAGEAYVDDCFFGLQGGSNLLTNPGFESGTDGWVNGGATIFSIDTEKGRTDDSQPTPTVPPTVTPTATPTTTPAATPAATPMPTPVAGSAARMEIKTLPAPWKPFVQGINTTVPGDTFQASFWMKGTGQVTVQIKNTGGSKQYSTQVLTATGTWTKYELPEVTATGTDGIAIWVFGTHQCDILMDDFFLGKKGSVENLLSNPGFEEGFLRWGGAALTWTNPVFLWIDSENGRVEEKPDSNGFIDEFDDFSKIYNYNADQSKYAVNKIAARPIDFGGDPSRLMLRNNLPVGKVPYVIYETNYDIKSFSAEVFYKPGDEIRDISVSVSVYNTDYKAITLEKYDDGGTWQKIVYSAYSMPIENARYIKVEFPPVLANYDSQAIQISRISVNLSTPHVTALGDASTGITLSCPMTGAKIFYTLGSGTQEMEYTGPIPVKGSTRISAYAKAPGKEKSITRQFNYISESDILVDKYGQVKSASFTGKVANDQELLEDVAADAAYYGALNPPARDEYGGLPGSKTKYGLEAKGFFNIQKIGDRYVMVDPEGNLFFSVGSNGIGNVNETFTRFDTREHIYEWLPSKTDEGGKYTTAFKNADGFSWYIANLIKKYGKSFSEAEYYSESVTRMKKWGFTSEGAWSRNPQMGTNADNFPQYGFIYLPTDAKYYVSNADWKLLDIYRPDAADVIAGSFKQYKVDTYKDDPWIIGWFFGNEAKYQQFNAAVTAKNAANSATKQALMDMLAAKYGDIATLNASWQTEYADFTAMRNAGIPIKTNEAYADMLTFFEQYLEKYYSTVHEEFRKLNANHMLVGDRYLIAPMNNADTRRTISKVAGKYLDVLSYNYYTSDLDMGRLKEITDLAGKPLIFSEFHYAEPTHGLNGGIRVVENEEQKGKAYRNYVENAVASGMVVGTHWFSYLDQAATGRYLQGFSGEAYGIGMLDVTDRPYKTMLGHVMDTNYRIYDLVLGEVEPFKYSLAPEKPSDQIVDIVKIEAPIVIDGEKDAVWSTGKTLHLDEKSQVDGLVKKGISADIDMTWDKDNLYIYAHIKDDTPGLNPYPLENNPSRGIEWIWNGDALELFIGPEELDAKGQLREKDSQIIISAKGLYYWYNYNKLQQPGIDVNVKVNEADKEYAIEAAIPLASLGLDNATHGRKMRFDVGFDNGDGSKRIAQYFWNGVEGNAQNRDKWGTAVLVDPNDPAGDSDSSITPVSGSFDKKAGAQEDVEVTVSFNGNTLKAIRNGNVTLAEGTDYTVAGSVYSIKSAYLAAQPLGKTTLTFEFSAGKNQTLEISVSNTRSSGSSGGGTAPVPVESPKPKLDAATGKAIVEVKTALESGTGMAKSEISAAALTQAAELAKADKDGIKKISLELQKAQGAKGYELVLPGTVLTQGALTQKVEINTEIAKLELPSNMLKSSTTVPQNANISVGVAVVDKSTLDAKSKEAIGDRPVVEINLKVDGKATSWSNPSAPVSVSIPYKPAAQELKNPEHIVVYSMDGAGNRVVVPSGKYNALTGEVTFTTTNFGKYAIGYVEKSFSDIGEYGWAKKEIEVLASKGIIQGTAETTFAPSENITRADFLLLLVKSLGLGAKVEENFNDVAAGTYYYEAVGIAKKLGISQGRDNNRFAPEDKISRQEMMVLTTRAMKAAGKLNSTGSTAAQLDRFSDKGAVESYAVESIAALVKDGMVQGAGSMLNPLGNATRAEIAVLMYRIYNK